MNQIHRNSRKLTDGLTTRKYNVSGHRLDNKLKKEKLIYLWQDVKKHLINSTTNLDEKSHVQLKVCDAE